MERSAWCFIHKALPAASCERLALCSAGENTLELRGKVSIQDASWLNLALWQFQRHQLDTLHRRVHVCRRKLSFYTPQVRLGDVTTAAERACLSRHAKNPAYNDPNSMVDVPEWNSDFVAASDRRYRDHIKPRYLQEDERMLEAAAAFVADHCTKGEGIVVHTGAGISAAAGIATYREGSSKSIAMSAALPTYAHYALVVLSRLGAVDYVVSQNVDGLHRRSGLSADRLSELHGNSYIETCSCCSPPMEFVRPYDVYSTPCSQPTYWSREVEGPGGRRHLEANTELTRNELASGICHITGRACPKGGGPLRDSIIHFGESLPQRALEEAERRAKASPLNMVIGSSLLVTPASRLPFVGEGPVVIVSLTCTGSDVKALRSGGILLHCAADAAMERIMGHMKQVRFPNQPQLLEELHMQVRARDRAILASDAVVPYDGGADGGVVTEAWLQRMCRPVEEQQPARDPPASEVAPPTAQPTAPAQPLAMRAAQAVQQLAAAVSRRSRSQSLARAATAGGGRQSRLQLKQTHQRVDEEWHQWTLGVDDLQGTGALQDVAAVTFHLHKTFHPSKYVLREPPFTVGPFKGWGTFTVMVEVELRNAQEKITAPFPLCFADAETVLELPVDNTQPGGLA